MKSKIAKAIDLRYEPVGILWTDTRPEGAAEFKENKWGCVMWMLARAAKGGVAVFTDKTYGCWGGGVGLGFGNRYVEFPGGEEGFCYFLSVGNNKWEPGKKVAEQMRGLATDSFIEDFLEGEGYVKSPELVKDFIENLPIFQIPTKYVVFKALKDIHTEEEIPVVVVFLAYPDELSALVVLANYGRKGVDNVIIPFGAGCQTIGIFPYREAMSQNPRAVIGLTDISSRLYTRKQLGDNLFSFTVPWKMFLEMEDNVEESFLNRRTWKALRAKTLS
ncbi:MAG: DUF169 domain-containing protein [Syntrophobacterales bacterium]|nr:DUF169 domain-containing protein [Syntrophobacterales bacterium]